MHPIFLATLYIITVCKLLIDMCINHAIAKSNTLPLDNKETPSIVLLSKFLFCSVHIVMIDILIRCSLIAE